jgi:hypothetical protein
VTKAATDRRGGFGGFGSFVAALPRAAVSAGAATLPAILGVYLYQVPLGFTASFGAYLVAITHPSLPVQGGAQRLATTVLMLSFGAVAGAASATRVWVFVPLAVVCATWQAWTELADNGLKLPAAMSVLALLLSAGNVSPDVAAVTYGAAFASGAVWQGLVQCIVASTSSTPTALLAVESAVLPSSMAAAPRFIGTMAALGFVGGAIAASLPVPHAGWLLTAALRVMKPTQAQTLLRLKQRLTGTIAGAVFAAGLLCWPLPALLHAGTLGIMLTLMQLVGAKRYAVWTFCLTVIALDLKSVLPQEIGWRLGEERILLTIGGLALAILFSLRLPRSGWSADFGSFACTPQCAPAVILPEHIAQTMQSATDRRPHDTADCDLCRVPTAGSYLGAWRRRHEPASDRRRDAGLRPPAGCGCAPCNRGLHRRASPGRRRIAQGTACNHALDVDGLPQGFRSDPGGRARCRRAMKRTWVDAGHRFLV